MSTFTRFKIPLHATIQAKGKLKDSTFGIFFTQFLSSRLNVISEWSKNSPETVPAYLHAGLHPFCIVPSLFRAMRMLLSRHSLRLEGHAVYKSAYVQLKACHAPPFTLQVSGV